MSTYAPDSPDLPFLDDLIKKRPLINNSSMNSEKVVFINFPQHPIFCSTTPLCLLDSGVVKLKF